ncbi:hypothetical protein [Faecalibaculum rodentium]|jgi:bifunctional DNA-binding transcriptional regulator/antitoxin component of YhaV-PrlF toxin-antitoxin module
MLRFADGVMVPVMPADGKMETGADASRETEASKGAEAVKGSGSSSETLFHEGVLPEAALAADWLQAWCDWKKKPVKVAATRQGVILDPMDRECLAALENIPYDTRYRVCRLGRAVRHKPQDRVVTPDFSPFSRLQAVGPQGAQATLWTNPAAGSEKPETGKILLTNRLIRTLYGREWIEGTEETPGLEGAPLLVGADFEENYDLGLPKADQISRVYFSSLLYQDLEPEAADSDFWLYNPLTDTRMYLPFEGSNYQDHGRVVKNGKPARKVMVPRYYRILMGWASYPVVRIRKESYVRLLEEMTPEQRDLMTQTYHPVESEMFYDLDAALDPESRLYQDLAVLQTQSPLFHRAEILRRPRRMIRRPLPAKLWNRLLEHMIGTAEFDLKVTWTQDTDDRNNIARLNPDMMTLLGVGENDKIIIRYGRDSLSLRVLNCETLDSGQIGLPAPARLKLGMNSVNDVVTVERNMNHILSKYSQVQAMTILGTLLAVSEVLPDVWTSLAVSALAAPVLVYFVLREEREKVR